MDGGHIDISLLCCTWCDLNHRGCNANPMGHIAILLVCSTRDHLNQGGYSTTMMLCSTLDGLNLVRASLPFCWYAVLGYV